MDVDIDRKITNYYWIIIDNLAHRLDKIAQLYDDKISKEYEKECKEFDMQKNSNILHIGCGAYPITAMTINKIHGAKIVCIDKNPKSVKLARNLINKKNLQDKITIEQGNGENYPVDKFDTIIISGCSYPREKILKHIFEKAKNSSKIIVRDSNSTLQSLIEYIDSFKNIKILKRFDNSSRFLFRNFKWPSLYLTKESN